MDIKYEQAPGDGEGQRSLACCSPWGCKELDMREQPNNKVYQCSFPGLESCTMAP